ncbi:MULTISPECIES: methyltransferase domain-containing protein [Pimelobacter]|uniref:methyltransferase domain-containing protein n=1 Tax=Pimelobacter TaxID=2044 RepID=UPI001C047F8B|nr:MULTISPECIES: SNF2-related protein [Pimelobacter]MBU2698848.1 helicase [Pimelobacter sp. 30-1]UUW93038.1 methyltransferase domain-containing protein [Pimelobacter simplex]UUW99070.1 methyltransferase domain-containing protein [Pimelobacter simplex]
MAAIATSRQIEAAARPATAEEQQVLARWSSWGAIPQVFDDERPEWAAEREELRGLLDEQAYDAARRTTINAHYTDASYVDQMWITLRDLGFDGGDVLEPGCGSGTFIGMAPETARMVGVELDPTTAAIARGLYPQADIRTESFAETRFPRGHFDAVIGNVPFADVALYDPRHNAGGHSMHNHFIIKSLAMTRPGGMVAVVTSSFTMDATNPAARREMNAMADLVGAVRLPSGAHRRAAGTEAVTDILIFQRRADGVPPRDLLWETVGPRQVEGPEGPVMVRVNNYFDEHPDHLLGTLRVGTGMYGGETVHVVSSDLGALEGQLALALSDVVSRARERGQGFSEEREEQALERAEAVSQLTDLWDGTIVADPATAGFQVAHGGRLEPLAVPKTQAAELRLLLELRDGARGVLEAEARDAEDTSALAEQRSALRSRYDAYVEKYGPLNRYALRGTGRYEPVTDPETGAAVIDPATGEAERGAEVMARITPRSMVTFRQDPHSALVRALERFDEETQTSTPSSLLVQRVGAPRPVQQGAETPSEAIALSLDQTGRVELPLVARLLGVDETEARARLGDLVYDDPKSGQLVHAPEYLSGDVRAKLDAAIEAAAVDDRFQVNVDALREVLPDPIGVDEIEARLGAVWISAELHQQFLAELLDDSTVRVENPLPGEWEVRGQRAGIRATNDWGTGRRPATDLAQALMEQKRVEVADEVEGPDGRKRRVINPVETTAAQEKADALQERFGEWVWEDPQRASELAEIYNRRFNSIRLRDYSSAGDYLTLPGLTASIQLRDHQRAAVARMIAEPSVGLFHQVGAGKTLEMICGATEMKRMGLVSKPAVVVPNHMLEQFSREWLQAYPRARVLAASTADLTGDKRRLFVARAAANDWDAIILTQGAFKKIGLSADFESEYIARQLSELRTGLDAAKGADSMSVKRIEKKILAVEERHKKALAMPRDPGVNFQDAGIDYLVVDEAHMYKNLATVSNMRDAAIEGSQQATDLHMKLEYLRGKHGDRVATMATATPLANSVTEAYVMQRYLRPDLLEAAGVTSFDGWAATFGSQVTEMEMGPAGGFRLKTRFAKFQNVPEMLRMWHVFADVKTAEDLNLPVPELAPRASDGKRDIETVVLQPTPELEDYIAEIADRAEKVASKAVSAAEDNMLLISTDGRKAALDLRLVDQDARQSGTVKLDAVANKILTRWEATRDNVYLDEVTGQPSEIRGGMQMVFCDLGTPNATRWDAYNELRAKLIDGGMPPDGIRFIHDAKNDAAKARLFASARSGHVAVLIGSTGKMGVGTNVQARLTDLHHIDCPWRPADLEQRDGRGIRQGNQNAEVGMFRYVVERSFDAYSWQTVGRKATFIAQVMRGRLDTREIEDIGDTALSAAEAKALASGNPLVLEKASADAAYQKLRRQEVAFHRAQAALRQTRHSAEARIERREGEVAALRTAAGRTIDTTGEAFTMRVAGHLATTRPDAAASIAAWATRNQPVILATSRHDEPLALGTLGGHEVTVTGDRSLLGSDHMVMVGLRDVPGSEHRTSLRELQSASVGTIRAIENKAVAIERRIGTYEAEIAEAHRTVADVDSKIGRPFPHAGDLATARARVEEVDAALAAQAAPPEPAQAAPSAPGAGGAELSPAARAALEASGHGRRPTGSTISQAAPTDPTQRTASGDPADARVSRAPENPRPHGRPLGR